MVSAFDIKVLQNWDHIVGIFFKKHLLHTAAFILLLILAHLKNVFGKLLHLILPGSSCISRGILSDPRNLFQLACAASPLAWLSSCQDWCSPLSTFIAITLYLRLVDSTCLFVHYVLNSVVKKKRHGIKQMLTWFCHFSLADPRGQFVPLSGDLWGLGVCSPEGKARTGGECRHLPWW